VGRSNNTKQVYNGQGSRLTYCINCGCTPKPDQWENENSRLCIDCGGAE
jgi:membrane protease subunit (stomatin/prohibitin family)